MKLCRQTAHGETMIVIEIQDHTIEVKVTKIKVTKSCFLSVPCSFAARQLKCYRYIVHVERMNPVEIQGRTSEFRVTKRNVMNNGFLCIFVVFCISVDGTSRVDCPLSANDLYGNSWPYFRGQGYSCPAYVVWSWLLGHSANKSRGTGVWYDNV